ncbi:hypothetical protein BJ944DRAFT_84853 [Cunninghamella echinulata]|nr:hypothetical protein BJ944DRAFT_84853 [Cunninghamella echinulata]
MSKFISKISPTRAFFRCTQKIDSIEQSRKVINIIRQYGELVEYKTLKCPETQRPLRYGFVVFKYQEDAKRAFNQRFLKVPPNIFDEPCEIKIESSTTFSS